MSYFKRSIDKFTQDALSKAFYDSLKWVVGSFLLVLSTRLIPESTTIGKLLSIQFTNSLLSLGLLAFALVIVTYLAAALFFHRKLRRLQDENHTDGLTGLKNDKALAVYLPKRLSEMKQDASSPLAIIIIDVDNFDRLNKKPGHATATRLLAKVGETLGDDQRITDEVFRSFRKGDEFLIVANDTPLEGAYQAAERKRRLIESISFDIDGASYKLTVSCGVTGFHRGDDHQTIVDRASKALAEAKAEKGKNCSKLIVKL